ncbi:OsmC family protein [Pseudoxanthomonas suwonensis]|uniref:Osmotically inducible protein OsmC n=1 Tax=Pseudoxanthomonas suwonensis TaxID=314722 RepID=A0A0E3Z0C6_9GAMM|nr:OsmC family protein [Pseudoxanthomonas suwonensis]AKC86439.1 hypothetical protein WQ53_06325 [Pseudoxanthomonas suwonensis]
MSGIDHIASVMSRARKVFQRRPDIAFAEDTTATAVWSGGLKSTASLPERAHVETDMPHELGGGGAGAPPGWLFRAGIASCALTSIVMSACEKGIVLSSIQVRVCSKSDTRGLLGMDDASAVAVFPGPQELRIEVEIRADGVPQQDLHALVHLGLERSPMQAALRQPPPCTVMVDTSID